MSRVEGRWARGRRGPTRRIIGRAAAGILAIAFACGAYLYLTLPDVRVLRTENPEETAFMRIRADEARRRGEKPRRMYRWVGYGRISANLKRAVLVAEDAAFWTHTGIDIEQIKESMEINMERMEFARGASTITQQLAKNLYLSPSKNPIRKVRELLIARRLEVELTKPRILELYLNVIEWGDGIYGAEAASRTYFGKPASALGADESALLAAAIINPRVLNPGAPTARLRRRQQMILRRMGAVTPPANAAAPSGPGALPASEGVPAVLPGQALPPTTLPGAPVKPPGGR
ncbi:MAG TPA: monofunctional biosynthetic peptidoglycan transglycosylase [Vicinamibacterales bacterium]|nr:monofunctional biosynthetic peptidoglycan transglycosylase [Vicinamibacterales bacterium]